VYKLVEDDENSIEEETYVNVSEMPEFPGGTTALYTSISSKMNYPETVNETVISG
jgi:hypothetical protein